MTQDDIIKLAREAGIEWQEHTGITGKRRVTTVGSQSMDRIERFANLVAAAEREACANICDVHALGWQLNPGRNPEAGYIASSNCAHHIRKRNHLVDATKKATEPTDWSAA